MSSEKDRAALIKEIEDAGFSCIRCGACCSETEPGSNIVMVGSEEVKRIIDGTGFSFHEIVMPYPDKIRNGLKEYTFGWMIRHDTQGRCIFLNNGYCKIYPFRPWICRTYPFMLTENGLSVSPCKGIGFLKKTPDSIILAGDLSARERYEREMEESIKEILTSQQIPDGKTVVIDEDGIKDYYG